VVLLGMALLVVIVIGQGVAAAREQLPSTKDAAPGEDQPRSGPTSAVLGIPDRPGRDPRTDAYVQELLTTSRLLAAPVLPPPGAGTPATGAAAGTLPAGPDQQPGTPASQSSAILFQLGSSVPAKPVRVADPPTATDTRDDPPDLGQADIPERLRPRPVGRDAGDDDARAAAATRRPGGERAAPGRPAAKAPPVWPRLVPQAPPAPPPRWNGPRSALQQFGTIGPPQPVDYRKILEDPDVLAMIVGWDHRSREAIAALIEALPELVRVHAITDLALEHSRDLDSVDTDLLLDLLLYLNQDYGTQQDEEDLIILAQALGVRVWGLNLPLRVLAESHSWKDLWAEKHRAFSNAVVDHLNANIERDPDGNPGRVLVLVGMYHTLLDPSMMPQAGITSDASVASTPSLPGKLARAGVGATVVNFHTGDVVYEGGEHAQVEALRQQRGGAPFAVEVSGPKRLQNWIISPGPPPWLRPEAIPDPIAAGRPPWMTPPAKTGPRRVPGGPAAPGGRRPTPKGGPKQAPVSSPRDAGWQPAPMSERAAWAPPESAPSMPRDRPDPSASATVGPDAPTPGDAEPASTTAAGGLAPDATPPRYRVSLTLEDVGRGTLALPGEVPAAFRAASADGPVYQLPDGRLGLLRADGVFVLEDGGSLTGTGQGPDPGDPGDAGTSADTGAGRPDDIAASPDPAG